jgi:hypothetical protein
MTPLRTFAASGAACCAVLLAVVCWTGHALAQTSSYSNLGWGNQSVPQANPFRGTASEQWTTSQQNATATAEDQGQWQPTGGNRPAARATSLQQTAPPQPTANSSRWLLPNHQPTTTVGESADRLSTSRAGSVLTSAEAGQSAASEPREFAPPTNATKLASAAKSTDKTPSRAAARTTNNKNTVSTSPKRITAPLRNASAAVAAKPKSATHEPMAAKSSQAHRPVAAQSRPRQVSNNLRRAVDNWIKPVDFQEDGYVDGAMDGYAGAGSCESCNPGCPSCEGMGDGPCSESCGCANCGGPVCGEGVSCGCGVECGCEPGCGCEDGLCEPDCGCEPGCGCEPSCGVAARKPWVLGFAAGDPEAFQEVCVRLPKHQELMIFGGPHGFKGPYDRTRDSGNFGFHEGINVGAKVPYSTFGYQLGYQAVHSQLSGSENDNVADPHTQQFATAGMFRRARCEGLQFGAVWDMLRDERWEAVDFHQVRAEISYLSCGRHEFGAWAAVHMSEHEIRGLDEQVGTLYRPTDQYLLFYRFHGACGGEGRFYGGLSDESDAIVGADMLLPLQDRWSLKTSFAYLIPGKDGGTAAATQEAWNLSIGLVWHWDFRARRCHTNCYRPLFDVADNGWMIIDDRPGTP